MTQIVSRTYGNIYVRAVVGEHIHDEAQVVFFRQTDQVAVQFVVIRTACILGTDGNHGFIALEAFTHAAHIYRNHVFHACRNVCRSAMSYFFIRSKSDMYAALRSNAFFLQVFRIAQQYRCTKLVVQESALDETAFGYHGSRVEGYEVADHDAQGFYFRLCIHILIQQQFHSIEGTVGFVVVFVYMGGCIDQMNHAADCLALMGVNQAVFTFYVGSSQSAYINQLQSAVGLDFLYDCTQGVDVCSQQNTVFCIFAAQVADYASL